MQEKDDNLNLTMQQKFNFDSNSFEEEDTNTYRIKRRINGVRSKREKELVKLKNKYKKKYNFFFGVSVVLSIICFLSLSVSFLYLKNNKEEINDNRVSVLDHNIVFVGDSLTYFYDLEENFGSKYNLVNSGVSGNTTDDILDDIDNRVYKYNPSKVIIQIGINDMRNGKSNEYIYNNIMKIVRNIKEKRSLSKIYIVSLYPINDSDDEIINKSSLKNRTNEKIDYINKMLKEEVNGTDIVYIDINKKLKDENGILKLKYTVDGIHLNESGYKVITNVLFDYINE